MPIQILFRIVHTVLSNMKNLSSRSLIQVMPHSTEKKMYLFRDILIKLESPLLREQKRCVVPSDKSCIINQYKQTFMTIMEDQTSSYWRTGLFNKHPPSFRLFSFSLLRIWISKRMEQILPKRI